MDKRMEAVAFFRSEPFHHLFSDFRNKYESLGRTGGSVSLKNYKKEEIQTVADFMGKDPDDIRKRRLSLSAFEKRLGATKFESLTLLEILEAYFNEPITPRMQQAMQEEERVEKLFRTMEKTYPSLSFWVDVLREKPPSTYVFYPWMEQEEEFLQMVDTLDKAYRNMPGSGEWERLPKFSQRITRDPHAFDAGKKLGKLWLHLLSTDRGETTPKTAEAMTQLLETYGILRDDLMNFVTCANLLAKKEGELHPVWKEAYNLQLVRNVPLREIVTVDEVFVPQGEKVYIVENSGVCSMLLDEKPGAPIVSTQGQVKLAAWKLLDLLVESGVTLLYAGDFDPEGLRMAKLMKERYKENVVLWRMSCKDYETSEPDVELSENRLKKLESLNCPELEELAGVMITTRKAGYQEALIEEMVQDME